MIDKYLLVPLGIPDLSMTDTLVLSQLAYLKRSFKIITASNNYIAIKLGLSVRTIIRSFQTLSQLDYITIHYITNNNVTKRTIMLDSKTLKLYGLSYTKAPIKKRSAVLNDFLKK
jgi:hypothetical protein